MLHHPCILMGPQQRGPKLEVATSPLPSRGPKRGQKCYITPAFSWVPNKGDENQKWLPHPYLLGGPKEVKNGTSPLHSHGSPTKGTKIRSGCLTPAFSGAQKRSKMLHHPCILMGPQQRGPKSEVAASPLPSRGPKRGQKCYITPAFPWVPNKGDQNQKWLPHPYLLGGPKEVKNATSPLHCHGSPTKGTKIRSGCLTLAFSGAQKRSKMLHHPCIPMGPQQRGPKSEVAASPLPSRGPKRGQKCYITPAFSWVPNKGDQSQKWLPHPCLLGGPKEVKNGTSPLHSHGSPTKGTKIRSGCLTLAFSGAQKRSKMLHHPCILMGPQQKGPKSKVAASPLPSRGPKRGQKCYITPTFSWVPNKGDQNQKWLPHPCLLGGPKEVKNATSPLHSHGSPTKGTKIRSGYLTPAFSGAQKRSKILHHPCILMGPQQRGPKSEAHKGRKLSRWMTLPTAIASIASFHVHAVLHIIHSPCICVQQPASTSKREALQLSTCHRKPTQPGSSVPSTPPSSGSNPATRRKALHQYARGRKTHATTLHAPPTPGYCPHGAITQRSRWHSFGPRISSGPY